MKSMPVALPFSVVFAMSLMAALLMNATVFAAPSFAQSSKSSVAKKKPSSVNRFNRLFKGAANFNLPPMEDGIHDPENAGTAALQKPRDAFKSLPKAKAGNHVDWVKALNEGLIAPRADRLDPTVKLRVLNLNIVRQVKGSMPDVVYPHKPHTQWLQCSNCHPKIFIPKKGANKISMAAILAGQYCGVCHGKVAFPISQCRKCHSKNKTPKKKGSGAHAKVAAVKVRNMSKKALMKLGADVFAENCAGCHGDNGEGVPETFPPIKGSTIANGPASSHIHLVLNGVPDTAMPSWGKDLSVEKLAAVISFERNKWGNKGGYVQPQDVQNALSGSSSGGAKKTKPAVTRTKAQLMTRGKDVYGENCSGCHGEQGEGVPDTFPALKGSKVATGPVKDHIKIVLHGLPDSAMPSWKETLPTADIAAVITFERNAWGNKTGDLVQTADVAKAP